jgi:pimeloyl-ACP methyl ester carboxylesterase
MISIPFFGFMLWFLSAAALLAQITAPGQPVPHTTNPPVVFVSGYHNDCSTSTFAHTFGMADQVLHANGNVSLYFDNCTVAGKPSIEQLGAAFGAFLAALKYDDGSAVNLVDVVAHSMGGLIVRSYLSGKQEQDGVFSPPAATHIRNRFPGDAAFRQ